MTLLQARETLEDPKYWYDAAVLTAIADLAPDDGNFIVGDGAAWVAESGATARASLGLGTMATQAASSVAITGGTIDGATIGGTTAAAGTFTTLTASLSQTFINNTGTNWGAFSATAASNGKDIRHGQQFTLRSSRSEAGSNTHVQFYDASGGIAGTINTNGSGSTAYNTTSDERLKSDLQPFDPGPIIDAIPVHDFEMFGTRRRGFSSAQAMHAVFPEAATPGEGNPGEPGFIPWSIDPSAVVPLLCLEIKNNRARIAALEAAVAGLQG